MVHLHTNAQRCRSRSLSLLLPRLEHGPLTPKTSSATAPARQLPKHSAAERATRDAGSETMGESGLSCRPFFLSFRPRARMNRSREALENAHDCYRARMRACVCVCIQEKWISRAETIALEN
mmetsp:Transcript_8404/g.15423  ORF Transcript_8404/g.15423 Transcript_8404/m.15423 type:complete len:122 (+) Transcript_8404:268-633(+)